MDDDMANIIVAQLLYLDAVDPSKVKYCIIQQFHVLLLDSDVLLRILIVLLLIRILSCMLILLVDQLQLVITHCWLTCFPMIFFFGFSLLMTLVSLAFPRYGYIRYYEAYPA